MIFCRDLVERWSWTLLGYKPWSRSAFANRIVSKFFKRGKEEYALSVDKKTHERKMRLCTWSFKRDLLEFPNGIVKWGGGGEGRVINRNVVVAVVKNNRNEVVVEENKRNVVVKEENNKNEEVVSMWWRKNRNKNKMKRKKWIVEEQEAWVSKTLSSVLKRAIYVAFKAGIACFSKIFWEPGFTRFVTSTLFNQANFAQLLQA